MANTRSALKRIRQNEKRRLRNKAVKSRMRTAIRKFLQIINEGDLERAQAELNRVYSEIDRAARKGVIHPNQAARRKQRLARRLQAARAS